MPLSAPPAASRSPLRPVRYDRRGGRLRSSYCLLGGASDGAVGLIVAVMRSCGCLPHACLGSPATVPPSVSPTLALRMVLPHDALVRSFPSCPPHDTAPPIDTRDGEPGRGGSVVLAVYRVVASHRLPVSLLLLSGRFAPCPSFRRPCLLPRLGIMRGRLRLSRRGGSGLGVLFACPVSVCA